MTMSQTDSIFITESTFRNYCDKRDDDIKSAFNDKLSQFYNAFNDKLSQFHDTFDNKPSTVDSTLSGRLGKLKDGLDEVKIDMRNVKADVREVKGRLNQIEGRSFNKSRNLPHHSIAIIGVYQEPIGLRMPEYFPSTVKEFWVLRNPVNRVQLTYLIQFYDIKNFEYWGQTYRGFENNDSSSINTDTESDSEDSISKQDLSLENAIERYTDIALEELASCLGLPFGEICSFYKRAAEYEQQRSLAIKRRVTATAPRNEVIKRPKIPELQQSLELLVGLELRPGPTSAPTSSVESGRVSWDVLARNRAMAELEANMAPTSPGSSKDSSTDVISSRESRHLGDGKKPRSNKS